MTAERSPGPAVTRVADLLAGARRRGLERVDAQWLVGRALGRDRGWLVAHADAPVDPEAATRIHAWLDRHATGEPLAYLLGSQAFRQLELTVDRRVLVPRADTELLVDWAIDRLAARAEPSPRVVDLGTGSGAVALAVCDAVPRARVMATDASADALAVARGNADRLGLAIQTRLGDWWRAVDAAASFELAVSNPPYIAEGDAHLPALRHEPTAALVSGPDGLDAIRAIVAGAGTHLVPGAYLLLEHGHDQGPAVRRLLAAHGYLAVETRTDRGGRPRCTGGARGG